MHQVEVMLNSACDHCGHTPSCYQEKHAVVDIQYAARPLPQKLDTIIAVVDIQYAARPAACPLPQKLVTIIVVTRWAGGYMYIETMACTETAPNSA